MKFHYHTLMLYCAVCALGNNRVAHALCSHVDESQLFYAIENTYLPGPLRSGYYDLLISIHLESAKRARLGTNREFIVPMTEETLSIKLYPDTKKSHSLPGVGLTTCLRPKLHFSSINFVGTDPDLYTLSPIFPLQVKNNIKSSLSGKNTFLLHGSAVFDPQELKTRAISMLTEAVMDGSQAMRDPVGGSVEFHFVPILKLISTLLMIGIFNDEDTMHILKMIDPNVFSGKEEEEEGEKAEEEEAAKEGEAQVEEEEEELEDEGVSEEDEEELKDTEKEEQEGKEAKEEVEEGEKEKAEEPKEGKVDGEKAEEEKEAVEEEAKEEEEAPEEGLLQMKLPESVKLQVILTKLIYNQRLWTKRCNSCGFSPADVHAPAVLLRLRAPPPRGNHRGVFGQLCPGRSEQPARALQPADEGLHHVCRRDRPQDSRVPLAAA